MVANRRIEQAEVASFCVQSCVASSSNVLEDRWCRQHRSASVSACPCPVNVYAHSCCLPCDLPVASPDAWAGSWANRGPITDGGDSIDCSAETPKRGMSLPAMEYPAALQLFGAAATDCEAEVCHRIRVSARSNSNVGQALFNFPKVLLATSRPRSCHRTQTSNCEK